MNKIEILEKVYTSVKNNPIGHVYLCNTLSAILKGSKSVNANADYMLIEARCPEFLPWIRKMALKYNPGNNLKYPTWVTEEYEDDPDYMDKDKVEDADAITSGSMTAEATIYAMEELFAEVPSQEKLVQLRKFINSLKNE